MVLLLLAGCGKAAPVLKTAGEKEKDKTTVGIPGDAPAAAMPELISGDPPGTAQPVESSVPVEGGRPEGTPKIAIKTDNPVSNQEAGAMLDAVDKQLDELMSTLDRLDEISEEDLRY